MHLEICYLKFKLRTKNIHKWYCPSYGTTDVDRDLSAIFNISDKSTLELKAAKEVVIFYKCAQNFRPE